MKTMRIGKELCRSEKRAILLANGRTTALRTFTVAMLTVLALTSCCSDEDVLQTDQLTGTWLEVYDEGIVAEGFVQYTFIPSTLSGNGDLTAGSPSNHENEIYGIVNNEGDCTIHVYDVFAGDTTIHRGYALTDNGRRLYIYERMYGGTPEMQKYYVRKLSDNEMSWQLEGTDVVLNFRKTNQWH